MKIAKLIFITLLSLSLTGCAWGPGTLDETQDQILTVAYKSPTADFSTFKTFAITDSILVISGVNSKERVKDSESDMILQTVTDNMVAQGYTQVAVGTDGTDLVVDLSYLESTTTNVYPGYWGDWDWWWDWYNPLYPWYPYYPSYIPTIVSSYSTGTLFIDVADIVNSTTEEKVPVVWHGIVRSILNGKHNEGEIKAAINDCFIIMPLK